MIRDDIQRALFGMWDKAYCRVYWSAMYSVGVADCEDVRDRSLLAPDGIDWETVCEGEAWGPDGVRLEAVEP